MVNYYIRSQNIYVKVDTSTQTITQVLNISEQVTFSEIKNDVDYYNRVLEWIPKWTPTDQESFENVKNIVLSTINNL